MTNGKKGWVSGAISLAGAGLASRILGVLYIVPLQNMAGDYAMGLYSMAYSIYVVMLMVSTAGIPLAMSKLISERASVGDHAGVRRIYRVAAQYLTGAGVLLFLLLFGSADVVAAWLGDPASSTAIRVLSCALLLVPLLSAMRGYVQGQQKMSLSGNAQIVEQLIRVIGILIGVFLAVHFGATARVVAAAATWGAVLGAGGSLFYMVRHLQKKALWQRRSHQEPVGAETETTANVLRQLLLVSLPITLTSLVYPLSQMVDSVTITNLIVYATDWSREAAASEYGVFTARALRLLSLPLSLAVAVGTSLMPALSEAIAQGEGRLRDERVLTSLRLTAFFAFPSAVGLFVLASPLDLALFQDLKGADVIALTSLMVVFASYEIVCAYLLQALGHLYVPIFCMLAGLGLKLALNMALVPQYGIRGAAVASVCGYALSALWSLYEIRKTTGIKLLRAELFATPLVSSLAMGGVVWLWTHVHLHHLLPWPRLEQLAIVLGGAGIGAISFTALMIGLKGISQSEMRRLPVLRRLARDGSG